MIIILIIIIIIIVRETSMFGIHVHKLPLSN